MILSATDVKEGDIALIDGSLVEVVKVESSPKFITRRKEGESWFFGATEQIPVGDGIDKIWWIPVGDNSGKMYTSNLLLLYDWKKLIGAATRIIHQVNLLKNGNT